MSELEGFVGQEQGGTAPGRPWDLPWRPEGRLLGVSLETLLLRHCIGLR